MPEQDIPASRRAVINFKDGTRREVYQFNLRYNPVGVNLTPEIIAEALGKGGPLEVLDRGRDPIGEPVSTEVLNTANIVSITVPLEVKRR